MTETQIICCEPCKIPDLSLDLHRGEEVWVANELAKKSKDLKRVLAIGHVRVYQRVRDKKPRRHAPPSYQRLKPKVRTQTPAPAPAPPEKPAVEKVVERVVEKIIVEKVVEAPNTEALAAQIKQELLGEMAGTIEAAVAAAMAAQVPAEPTQAAPALDAATMAAIVQQAVAAALPSSTGGVVIAPTRRREETDEEVPLYLPTGIVNKDAKAEITVQSESKDSDDLDEAAKLLREMKRGKKQTDKDK